MNERRLTSKNKRIPPERGIRGNMFACLPADRSKELFEAILETGDLKLERIVSTGQATQPGQWYDQDRDEWLVLLSGAAGLLFEGDKVETILQPGDYLLIPAHSRHRVEWTAAGRETVWLALHFGKLA